MLPIYICEDIPEKLEQIKRTINKHIEIKNLDMKVVCATTNPHTLLEYLSNNRKNSLYFLDIDLKADIDGFVLAQRIRKIDPRACIVIITSHTELNMKTFEYRIQAMDFIDKSDIKEFDNRILSCLTEAYTLSKKVENLSKPLVLEIVKKPVIFILSDIYYIKAESHTITIAEKTKITNLSYDLSSILDKLDDRFFQCHKS
ncbi:response regulator [Kineothrix sedimenti]|uniref:Stage 0 sporulation protein A homolog n=1 Tax=Kineothrix sedimenti TaxID=3123317 RepID=A0ABZ3F1X4_9FIRM